MPGSAGSTFPPGGSVPARPPPTAARSERASVAPDSAASPPAWGERWFFVLGLLVPFLAVLAVPSYAAGDFGGFDRWSDSLWRGDGSLYGGGSDANYPVV